MTLETFKKAQKLQEQFAQILENSNRMENELSDPDSETITLTTPYSEGFDIPEEVAGKVIELMQAYYQARMKRLEAEFKAL